MPPPAPLHSLHHIALICADYPRSKHFYTQVLGLTIIAETYRADRQSWKLDLALPSSPGGRSGQLELFSFPNPPPRPTRPEARGLRHLAFSVTNLDAVITALTAHHIPVEPIRTDELTSARYTFFPDPDDLPIELYEVPAP
jgi:glyoxylase I family protein